MPIHRIKDKVKAAGGRGKKRKAKKKEEIVGGNGKKRQRKEATFT